jgi:glycosyltransferase involved in cell wall biosynthesis
VSRSADMRLAIDGRVLDDRYHGVGRVTESLLRGLAEHRGVKVVVFLRKHQKSQRYDLDQLTLGLGHERRTFDHAIRSPLQWLAWPKAIRQAGVDAVLFPYNLGASLIGSTDRYSIVHDCILEAHRQFAPGRLAGLAYRLVTAMVVRRTRVVTPSRTSADDLLKIYGIALPQERIVPWGVDRSFFGAGRPGLLALPELPANYLLHVGVRRPHKNVLTLVRMLTHLPEDQYLVLVGSVDQRFADPVPEVSRSLGVDNRIIHLPYVEDHDLIRLYGAARGFIYPSLAEGFGLPLLEAMAAGVPVLASEIPVFREVVGAAATLVPPSDEVAWARAVRRLEDVEFRAERIRAGRSRAGSATWDRAVDALVEIFRTDVEAVRNRSGWSTQGLQR